MTASKNQGRRRFIIRDFVGDVICVFAALSTSAFAIIPFLVSLPLAWCNAGLFVASLAVAWRLRNDDAPQTSHDERPTSDADESFECPKMGRDSTPKVTSETPRKRPPMS